MMKNLRIGFQYLQSLKWAGLMALILLFLSTLMEGVGLGVLIPVLEQMNQGATGPGDNLFSQYTFVLLTSLSLQYTFISLVLLFSALMFIKFALEAILAILMKFMSATMKCSLRRSVCDAYLSVPLSFYHRRSIGQLLGTAHTSSDEAGALVESSLQLTSGLLAIVVFISIQTLISPSLTLISVGLIGLSYYFIIPRFRVAFLKGGDAKAIIDRYLSFLQETLSGIRTAKAFQREDKHRRDLDEILNDFLKTAMSIQINKVCAGLLMEPLSTAMVVILLITSVLFLKLETAALLAFFVLLVRLAMKFRDVNTHYLYIVQNWPHVLKIQEILAVRHSEDETEGFYRPKGLEGDIHFQNVSYRYEGREDFAIQDLNFTLDSQKITALVGATGAGKSTVVDIILKHISPSSGKVMINGRCLEDINVKPWLDLIGVVEQEPFLFHASVADNIRYGKLDASQHEIECAAQIASVHNFISSLPEGYETVVGARGTVLSGGERQRISLARALVKNPQFLILDEATSALDSVTENLIQDAIEKFKNEKTLLVVAHRLSTVISADLIVQFDKGQIVEIGTHQELLAAGGLYAKNVKLQRAEWPAKKEIKV
jgi:ATP-binding cassette, subfamily B, bacterial MsbA